MRLQSALARSRRLVHLDLVDLVLLGALSWASYTLRRPGLPRNGLFYDDAWVAGGAVLGTLREVPMTGGAHPGFTTLLWIQHQVIGGPVEHLAWIAFLFGVLGPAFVFVCLRRLRYDRTGCLLAAAALMVTEAHVLYSGRVKSYTLDVVFVMALITLLPVLARRRWTWWGVAGWVGMAVAVGSLSGYLMLSSALAIGLLVLNPCADRRKRVTALAAQGVIQGGWVLYARQFVDLDEIEVFMETGFDAHVERSRNPIVLAQNVFDHLTRVVDVHPGAPAGVLGLVAVALMVGLVLGALGRLDQDRALASQFALAALVTAAVGGVLHRFPFGPATHDLATAMGAPGARHGLWLVPVTSIALCNLIEVTTGALAKRPAGQLVVRVVVVLAAILLVTSRWEPAPQPNPGAAHHLTQVVDAAADDGAFIVVDQISAFTYLLLSSQPSHLEATPTEMVGYLPVPDDGVVLGPILTAADVADLLATSDHQELVFVGMDVPYDAPLKKEGWVRSHTEVRNGFRVAVWRRG